jgi:uncharacterized membrane protein YkoI
VSENELPPNIAAAVKNKYADYKIDSAEVYERDGTKTYKIEIEKGWFNERDLTIDASGKIVNDIED